MKVLWNRPIGSAIFCSDRACFPGVLLVEGADHARMRKIMVGYDLQLYANQSDRRFSFLGKNPSFGPAHLKAIFPLFLEKAHLVSLPCVHVPRTKSRMNDTFRVLTKLA